jgi:tetratricopeptide (TPR) repeat protein
MQTMNVVLSVMMLATVGVSAQTMESMPGMEHGQHHHHHDVEKLGAVSFPVSCGAEAQAGMQRGIALLHSFGYTEAQMQFADVVKDEPKCAMGHWGVAMAQFTEIWGHPGAKALKLGSDEMAQARKLGKKVTPREQAYIGALSAFYSGGEKTPYQQRAEAYAAKMDELHAQFPEDVEGAAFDALAILASERPDDTSLTHERKALAILVPLFQAHPDHPGLAHYIIHTCDTPALAQDGLAAAREYAQIAPSSAHALHMPGHIFARLGMWPEDIASNEASVKASEKAKAEGQPGAAHQMHAEEFLIYAYLQVGEDAKAKALQARMRAIGAEMAAMPGMDDMKDGGNFFDNEVTAIYGMEMHEWKRVAGLQPAPGSSAVEGMFTVWGNGVAAGHLKDAALGAKSLATFDAGLEALKKGPYADMAPMVTIKRNEVAGWAAYAAGKSEEAVRLMRAAADQQDKLGQAEVDIPAREMLGDLLMMLGKPEAALVEYEVALKLSPNRLNGLLGAGAAAEAAGKMEMAKGFYREAAKQTDDGKDSQRPELIKAVKMVGVDVAAR